MNMETPIEIPLPDALARVAFEIERVRDQIMAVEEVIFNLADASKMQDLQKIDFITQSLQALAAATHALAECTPDTVTAPAQKFVENVKLDEISTRLSGVVDSEAAVRVELF